MQVVIENVQAEGARIASFPGKEGVFVLVPARKQRLIAGNGRCGRVEGVLNLSVFLAQIVAMVAMDSWKVPDLHRVIRRAYPYRDLSPAALETVLSRADSRTIIIPGHGPVSNRAELAAYRDMLVATGRRVRELIGEGRNLDEVLAARPTAAYDATYGQGSMTVERFVGILYEDLAGRR